MESLLAADSRRISTIGRWQQTESLRGSNLDSYGHQIAPFILLSVRQQKNRAFPQTCFRRQSLGCTHCINPTFSKNPLSCKNFILHIFMRMPWALQACSQATPLEELCKVDFKLQLASWLPWSLKCSARSNRKYHCRFPFINWNAAFESRKWATQQTGNTSYRAHRLHN